MILKMVFRLLLVAMIAGPVYFFWPRAERDSFPAAKVEFGQSPKLGGTVSVTGLIVSATLDLVQKELDAHPGAVQVLRVRSEGGTVAAAARLAQVVNGAGLFVRVEAQSVCAAACVMLLGDVEARLRVIDNRAWLLVRGNSDLPAGVKKPDSAVYMAKQVGELSPAWLAFLRRCASEPVERSAGLAMTWGEVQSLVSSVVKVECEKIAFRTRDWLFGPSGPMGGQSNGALLQTAPNWLGGVDVGQVLQ